MLGLWKCCDNGGIATPLLYINIGMFTSFSFLPPLTQFSLCSEKNAGDLSYPRHFLVPFSISFSTSPSLDVSLDLGNNASCPASPTRFTSPGTSKPQQRHQASAFLHQRTMGHTTIPHVHQLHLPRLNTRDYIAVLQLRGFQLQPSGHGYVRAEPLAWLIARRVQLRSMWIRRGVLLVRHFFRAISSPFVPQLSHETCFTSQRTPAPVMTQI